VRTLAIGIVAGALLASIIIYLVAGGLLVTHPLGG
jgi:hypothetical protein